MTKRQARAHRLRHGLHQKQNQKFLKTYWPYMPLLIVVGLILSFNYSWNVRHPTVLGYTNQLTVDGLLKSSNAAREGANRPLLELQTELGGAAQAKANDMAQRNYWSHQTPEGHQPWIFIDGTGYNYGQVAENLAYGFDTSADAVAGWMNSPSHRENLLQASHREVGFGIAHASNFQNRGPTSIVVAFYAEPAQAAVKSGTNGSSASSSLAISRLQTLFTEGLPWISYGLGLISGVALVALFTRKAVAVKRALKHGEQFVLHHPLFDITILSILASCYLVSKTAGVIL